MHFYMHSYLHKKFHSCKKWVLHMPGSNFQLSFAGVCALLCAPRSSPRFLCVPVPCFALHLARLLSFGSLSPCTWRLDAVVQLRDRAKTLAPGWLPSHGSFLLFTGSRADSSARLVLALIFVFLSRFSNHARPGHVGLRPQSSLSRA
jgi:hypothetical protein